MGAPRASRPVVVHATEAMGGGVQSAIATYTGLLSEVDHVVLGRPRNAEATHGFGPNVTVRTNGGGLFRFLVWLRRSVVEIDPDVVHIHSSLAGVARLLLPRRFRVIYSPHCFSFERTDIGRGKRTAYRVAEAVLALRTDAFVAVSPHEQELCRSLNPRAASVFVPNVVRSIHSAGRESPRRRVVMTGRIGAQKDPAFYAAVARHVSSPIQFVWIGDGDDGPRRELEQNGVDVTGWLPPSQVSEMVARASLYVHTGAWEAAPFASMEAAASGTPVLARDIPTMRSLGYAISGPGPVEVARDVDRFFSSSEFAESVRRRTADVASRYSEQDARDRLRGAYGRGGVPVTGRMKVVE